MMADNNDRTRMSTCPICGFTDAGGDAEVMQMAIEEHIRMTHNLDPATLGGTTGSVQPVTGDVAAQAGGGGGNNNTGGLNIPVIAASPHMGGADNAGAGFGAGAGSGLLGAAALDDNDDSDRNRTSNRREEDTSRF